MKNPTFALLMVMSIFMITIFVFGGVGWAFANDVPSQVTDPAGDSFDDPNSDPDPDLISGDISCSGTALHLSARFVQDTFSPVTRAAFVIDIDGNPLTGRPGTTTGGIDSNLIGMEYQVSLGGNFGSNASILKFIAPPNTFATIGSFPATMQVDGYDLTIPLSIFDNDDGLLTYKILTSSQVGPTSSTGTVDFMPDIGLVPGRVISCESLINANIDIKPGSVENPVNLGVMGVLPVAILTTRVMDGDSVDFNAVDVDLSSLNFQGASAKFKGNSGKIGSLEDIDGDGDLDLVVQFPVEDLRLNDSDTVAVLQGQMLDGIPFEGSDSIQIVP